MMSNPASDPAPPTPRIRTALLCILGAAVLAACATTDPGPGHSSEPPPLVARPEPSPSDVFERLDEALRRLALTEPQAADPDRPGDLWGRLIGRFEFAHCPEGGRAEAWAKWYAERPDYMDRVMQRARPWLHDIANEIERRELPGELALLPIVESAYDPFAYSHGRASGTWQFLAPTARDFGLEINDWYDGRRDVYAATRAALEYLASLGELFEGDWNLALAAYNAGQGRVQRAQRRNAARGRSTEWHALPLPRETRSYVPKLNGLGCLFREAERFGFETPELEDKPRIERVELPGPVDVVVAAELAGLQMDELVSLNPGLNRHMTSPSGPHHLIVPPGRGDLLKNGLNGLDGADRIQWREIRVQRGDTLSGLARRHDTGIQALREANGLNGDLLVAGQRLQIPALDGAEPDPRYLERYEQLAELQKRLLPTDRFRHRVRPGESLWVIARRYGVDVADLQRMNGLGSSTLIRPGQQLVIETGQPMIPAATRVSEYTVRSGDSLWTIARRHGVALADLMRWNGLDRDSVLQPGQKLRVRPGSDA